MDSSPGSAAPQPLRLWPAIVLLGLLWFFRLFPLLLAEVSPTILAAGFFVPVLCALLIWVWWMAGSRATRREKVIGALGLLGMLFVSVLVSDATVRGFGTLGSVWPWAMTMFTIGVIATKWFKVLPRVAVGLVAAALAFGFWAMVRMDGVSGDFKSAQSWRWEATAEDRFLAERAGVDRTARGSIAVEGLVGEAEWPGYRGPHRDAVVPGIALAEDWIATPPRELWRIRIGPGWSSFAVAGNRLFTQEQRGEFEVVVAYDTETGTELWVHESRSRFFEAMGGIGPRATPTLAGDRLFTLGAEGLLHRLDPTTGRAIWQADLREDGARKPPMWGFSSSPLVVDDLVIVHAGGDGDRGLLAYDVENGAVRWSAPAPGHSYSSPQLSQLTGQRSVLLVTGDGLTAVDPTDGEIRWQYDWPYSNYRTLQPLMIDDDSLLISTGYEGTRRIDVSRAAGEFTATDAWTSRSMKPDFNDYVIHRGSLYGFDPGILAAVDLETGERQWKGGRYGSGQLLLLPDADQLLVQAESGEVVLVRATPEKHEELARFPALDGKTWNHPVLVGDRLYTRNAEEAVAFVMPTR